MSLRVWLLVLCIPISVRAQGGFELDLTEEQPATQTPEEFRPTVAILAVTATDADAVSQGRAALLEAELVRQLAQEDLFGTVMEPAAAQQSLGNDAKTATACVEFSCLETVAKTLKVDRLIRIGIARQGVGSVVTFWGFDPAFSAVLKHHFESQEKAEQTFLGVAAKTQAQKDREFLRKATGFLRDSQHKLATPNGKIAVDTVENSSVVTIDGAQVGLGSMEAVVQRGAHTVRVTAPGFEPFEQTVNVEPLRTAEVKVTLVALPMTTAPAVRQPLEAQRPLFSRPGLYVSIAGAALLGAGIALGQSVEAVKSRIDAGGEPVGVTRAEAKAAALNATLANVLGGVGAAAIAGGITWILVTPAVAPSALAPSNPGGPGVLVQVGGGF